jgi:hypothetical protein
MAQAIVTAYEKVAQDYAKAHANYKSLFYSLIQTCKNNGVSTSQVVYCMGRTIEDMGQKVSRLEYNKGLLDLNAHPDFDLDNEQSVKDLEFTINEHRISLEKQEVAWNEAYTYWVNKANGN